MGSLLNIDSEMSKSSEYISVRIKHIEHEPTHARNNLSRGSLAGVSDYEPSLGSQAHLAAAGSTFCYYSNELKINCRSAGRQR